MKSVFTLSIALIFALLPILTNGQGTTIFDLREAPEEDTLRVGLVLSGGGAKGLAHIGVIKQLENAGVRIDYITGTSMGALVGGLYAIGYTTEQLREIAKTNRWDEMFQERPSRRLLSNHQREFDERTVVTFPITETGIDLPFGILTGQNIYSFLARFTWPVHGTESFDQFPIPFAAVATNLETGEAVTFRDGFLPDALRASISIPSLMIPHRIQGVDYIDGGLADNLPVQQALDMGANYIIAVNVSSPLKPSAELQSLMSVLNQVVSYQITSNVDRSAEKADIYIVPEDVRDHDLLDFEKVDLFYDIGYREAEKYLEMFRMVASMQHTPAAERRGVTDFGSLPINNIIVGSNQYVTTEFIMDEVSELRGAFVSPETIESKINELYSTQLFDLITYRIVPDPSYFYNLHINVVENQSNLFKVGLRFESETQASLLFDAEFRNLLHSGSNLRFDLRVGDNVRFRTDYLAFGTLGSRTGLRGTVLYKTEDVKVFDEDVRIASFSNQTFRSELSIGNYLASNSLFAVGIRQDFIGRGEIVNFNQIPFSSKNHHAVFAKLKLDRLDRKSFPRSGQQFIAVGTYSDEVLLSPISYNSFSGMWNAYYSIGDVLTFHHLLYGGITSGDSLPWDSWFTVNRYDDDFGYIRFGGFNRFELTSRNIQLANVGFRLEPLRNRFFSAYLHTGRFMDNWTLFDLNQDPIEYGFSASAGLLSIIGPIEAIISTSRQHSFLFELQLGFQF
ncbi:MAG: patatin-like phospholipase family protein [Balneolaceae bacterium]